MSILSDFLGGAAKQQAPASVTLPYMWLQKYFQLFVDGIHTIKVDPALNDPSISIPGQLLKHFDHDAHLHFLNGESSFTATGSFSNDHGGHIFHGEYTTNDEWGGVADYIYILVATSTDAPDKKGKNFIPHFMFVGARVVGEEQQMVHTTFVLSQSGYDGNQALSVEANEGDIGDVVSALAYADIPFKAILSNQKLDTHAIAAEYADVPMVVRWQKFDFLSQNRTPSFLNLEIDK